MPGVVVTTAVRTGPTTANVTSSAKFFVVGQTERGPVDSAELVTSISEFEQKYGGYVSYGHVHPQVQTFFEEGGAQCYVARVASASATVGTKVLQTVGSQNSLELIATGPGAWSSKLSVQIIAAGAGFAVKLYYTEDGVKSLVYSSGECATAEIAANKINTSSLAASYCTAEASGNGNPAVMGADEPFSAGTDDLNGVVTANYTAALDLFLDSFGAGAVAIPGIADGAVDTTIWDALKTHCDANHRIALCSFAENATVSSVISAAQNYAGAENAEHMGFFFPWVQIERDTNILQYISPEGYVAGKRAAVQNSEGPWRPYAGLVSEGNYVIRTKTPISKAESDALDEARVNGIRMINGRVRVYGARSASNDEANFRYLNAQEMLNYVVVESQARLEDLVFSTIDGRQVLFSAVRSRLVSLLDPIRVAGGLYEAFDAQGNRIDYGYTVVVNEAINPVSQLAGGLVKAKVGIRVSSVGDQIEVAVTKSNLTASVV